jgi:glutamate-1-semialdehyde aminotransferase
MHSEAPRASFLQKVRDATHRHEAVLVFDETITGFRYGLGGAQEELGVIPDMATFGKGLANGYPLSALVGRAKYMDLIEQVFFSGTFGGETLSLAAAKAVLTKLRAEPVTETLKARGRRILDGVNCLISDVGLNPILEISGHPSLLFLQFKDAGVFSKWQVKTLFLQEVFRRGIYILGTHNLSYAHSEGDIDALLRCYGDVFPLIKNSVENGTLDEKLRCAPLVPLFTVR